MSKFKLEVTNTRNGFCVLLSEEFLDRDNNLKTGIFKEELYKSTSELLCNRFFSAANNRIDKKQFKCTTVNIQTPNLYVIYESIKEVYNEY